MSEWEVDGPWEEEEREEENEWAWGQTDTLEDTVFGHGTELSTNTCEEEEGHEDEDGHIFTCWSRKTWMW